MSLHALSRLRHKKALRRSYLTIVNERYAVPRRSRQASSDETIL
jgi:hypothetical protein